MTRISKGTLELSDKKKALLKHLLHKETTNRLAQQHEASATEHVSIPPRADRATYPLSLSQQRLWQFAQLVPHDPALQLIGALELNGPLDMATLHQSLQALVQRHEILRATFMKQHDTPVQVVMPTMPANFTLVDLSQMEPETARQALMALLSSQQPHAFDLENGPLFKFTIVKLTDAEHGIVLSLHAIIADNSTLALLSHELLTLYSNYMTGQETPRPESALSYADYASWQREYLQDTRLEEQRTHWKQRLADVNPTLNLPFDHQQPAMEVSRQDSQTVALAGSLVERAQNFCLQEGLALPDFLFAIFILLLNRYTGQEDIFTGFLSPARTAELDTLPGPFANILPISTQITAGLNGQAFLQQVYQALLDARQWQDLPFEQIVEMVSPQHDLTRTPFCRASFAYHQLPAFPPLPPGLAAQWLPITSSPPHQDLACVFSQGKQALSLTVLYTGSRFDAPTIERFHLHYQQLLHAFLERPTAPLFTLSCLTPAEQRLLFHEWNASMRTYMPEPGECIHHLFERQVARTPGATALSDGQQQLIYQQLNNRANQLAHLLRRRGIGPENMVGLCLNRSPDLVIGLLAILKSGAAYVPLDPSYPRERLSFMVQDAGLDLILTQRDVLQHMPFAAKLALCLDVPALYENESSGDLGLTMNNTQLAYIIYTSGSTGRPKGVCISHRNAVVFLAWVRQHFSQEELAGVFFATSICFDLSIFELFAPLIQGGRAILAANVLDLPLMAKNDHITLVNTVPSAAAALLSISPLPTSIQTVNLAGEALKHELVQVLYQEPGVQRVCNLYGPTEDTTYSIWATMSTEEAGAVPIGRPLTNTQAYIVDAALQPVPPGIVGELYLGGDGQARGYLNRPDLTAERFIPDPFSNLPGRRLYKTGDLARYRPDGTIDYLGRLDHQVKIRGFRIELGEIELQLRKHPAVADAIVVAWEDTSGERRLVAYLVARRTQRIEIPLLRQHVLDALPAYMLPAFFLVLDQLPLTVNGKVDRKALPTPDNAREHLNMPPGEMPQGKREQWLALQWQEILQLPTVGRNDTFFSLGGDSLRAMQLLARLRNDAQQDISLTDLFAAPTIAQLAALIQVRSPQSALPSVISRQKEPSATALPLSPDQQRIWFVDQLEVGTPMYNVTLALALQGPLNRLALYQALREIIRRHAILRATIRVIKGSPFLFIADLPTPALSIVDLSHVPEASSVAYEELSACPAVLSEMQAEVQRPFDLSSGPLLRARLLRIREESHILQLTMHHIISDDWSISILMHELTALYNAFVAGQASPLVELPVQYTDFVAWQRTQQLFAANLTYWKERFTPLPPTLNLPTDHPRPMVQTFEGASLHFHLSSDLARQVHAFSQKEGVTLFMTLFTAFLLLLADYSGEEDLVVGVPVANRPRPELEELIGFFVNTLALRADLTGNPSGRELLRHVYAITLSAFNHQEVPFTRVVEAVQPQHDPARSPLFQVLFGLQNTPGVTTDLDRLHAYPIEIAPPTSQFDLSFFLDERCDGLHLTIEYNTRLFVATTIEGFYTRYQTLLHDLCAQPDAQIQELLVDGHPIRRVNKQRTEHTSHNSLVEEIWPVQPEQPVQYALTGSDAPQGPLEESIARAWQTILKLPVVDRTENFFEIGGHSLLAMRVLATLREEIQVPLSVHQFFAAPTIAGLAALIASEDRQEERPLSAPPPLIQTEITDDLPLSFAQQRLWFLDQLEGRSATYNIPVALLFTGPFNLPIFQQSMREIVRRHEILRTTFLRAGDGPIQCIHDLPITAITVIELPVASEHDGAVQAEIQAEVQRPFDLAEGPLLRIRILRLSEQKHVVIFTMHHIISDGWSIGILAAELSALYSAFVAGRPSPLPELPIQYADFAVWQRTYLQGSHLDAHLAYWRQQLTGAPMLHLPTDHPRTSMHTAQGASCSQQWDLPLTNHLFAFSQQEGVTPFMTLLTGFVSLLAYYSKQEDITIGTSIANRPHPELEHLVGFFVNTLALRINLAGNPSRGELLRRVRVVALDAFEHQDVPFEQIVEAVRPQREAGRSPLFQVFFGFENTPTADLALTDVQTESLAMHTTTAKFDLAVGLEMHKEGLAIGTEYNSQIFEHTTIEQFQTQYRTLLEHLVTDPECKPLELCHILFSHPDEKK